MSKFRIVETAAYEVEAENEKEALKLFLAAEDRDKKYFVEVNERTITDEDGNTNETADFEEDE